jgi:hypothetical protein
MNTSRLIQALLTASGLLAASNSWAYGWVGHWRVLESSWDSVAGDVCPKAGPLPPFAKLTPREAGAAALGAVFSDIGYVPLAPRQFSDLLHYIGAGEFTDNLTDVICETYSRDRRMIAFAAGFRTHYWADRLGHFDGTNKSAAKLSPKGSPYLPRMVYEEDHATHRRLEIVAHSVFDLKNGPAYAAAAYVETAGDLPDAIVGAVTEAVRRTYGNAGLQFVPNFQQIRLASFAILQSVCRTVDRVYAGGPKNASAIRVSKSCVERLKRGDVPKETEPSSGFLNFVDDGLKYTGDKIVEKNYEESVARVEFALRTKSSGRLPNFNLDTNLPSLSGQYKAADAAYELLVKSPPKTGCDSKAFDDIAQGKASSWKDYQKAGVCLDKAVRKSITSARCDQLLADRVLSGIVDGWLADIRPHTPGNRMATPCTPGTSGGQGPTFKLDATCAVSSAQALSPIELLYGCAIGHLAPKDIESRRYETSRRLRLRESIDASTGLYKP